MPENPSWDEPLPGTCEGCDEQRLDVRKYEAIFSDQPEKWIEVFYCGECSLLAEVNWNGETLELRKALA